MKYLSKSKWLFGVLVGCLASLLIFGMAFAEGETPETAPPEEVPAEEMVLVEPEPEVIEAMPEDEGVPPEGEVVEVAPLPETEETAELDPGLVEEVRAGSPDPEVAETPEELVELAEEVEALADSGVTLVDSEGQPLDMASEEAVQALAGGDPWWKVGTTTYMTDFPGQCPPGTLGVTCWESTTPITEALNRIVAMGMLPSDRKLYVEAGTYTETITINGAGSILAGLNGLIGDGSGTTLINGNVNLYDNTGGFTLSGFEINGQVYFSGNSGTAQLTDLNVHNGVSGIRVLSHNGTIKVKDVTSSNHQRRGAWLDNTDSGSAGIEVTNSSFNHNTTVFDDSGLDIYSNGNVTINGGSASNNINGNGLSITEAKSVTIKNSVFSNNSISPDHAAWGYGVIIRLDDRIANVTLENVYANTNENTGIKIVTMGVINLKDVQASFNGFGTLGERDGIFLDNCVDDGSGLCLSTTAKPVSVKSTRVDDNGADGLEIFSKSGVTIDSIRAYNNVGSGLYINNCMYHASVSGCQGSGSVTIKSPTSAGVDGVNYFGHNGGYGVYVYTRGSISVSNFNAEYNSDEGLYLDNNNYGSSAGVTIKSTISGYINNCSHQTDEGLDINSHGTISISKIACNFNTGEGADLDNDGAVSAKSVTVSDSEFLHNDQDGLEITSKGNVTLINVSSSFNGSSAGYHGVYVDNTYGTGNVTIKSSSSKTQYDCSYNTGHGIYVLTFGSASIRNMNCKYNDYNGVFIENDASPSVKSISLSNGEFSYNAQNGIELTSRGAISLKDVSAKYNSITGAMLDNCLWDGGLLQCLGSGTLTVSGSANHFSFNDNYGMRARSGKNISLTNVHARYNDWDGLFLSNGQMGSTGSVTVKTSSKTIMSELTGNGGFGNFDNLIIFSNGPVTIQNVLSTFCSAFGIRVDNPSAGISKSLKIIRSTANYNHYGGIYLNTNSNLIVTDTSADYNDTWGLMVDTDGSVNISCTGPLGSCSFSGNATGDGLDIYARKSITISKIVANGNGDSSGDCGMDLHNYTTPSELVPDPINLTNIVVNDNFYIGVNAITDANITLNTVTAIDNNTGVWLQNNGGTGNVTVKGTNLLDANNVGMRIYSNGTVNVSKVTVQNSITGNGLYVYAYTLGKTVTLTNIVSRYNAGHGIYINSHGNISLNTVNSIQNGTSANDADGIYITNPEGSLITIKNSNFLFNMGNGISANVLDPNDASKFKLISVNYFGNDADNDGDVDLLKF